MPGIRTIGAGVVAVVSVLGDAVLDSPAAWKSLTLDGCLLTAVIYLYRELNTKQAKREEMLREALESNTKAKEENTAAVQDLKAATDAQTSWFKVVAQNVINQKIHPSLPKEPES